MKILLCVNVLRLILLYQTHYKANEGHITCVFSSVAYFYVRGRIISVRYWKGYLHYYSVSLVINKFNICNIVWYSCKEHDRVHKNYYFIPFSLYPNKKNNEETLIAEKHGVPMMILVHIRRK